MIHAVGLFLLMLLKIAGWILLVLLAVILAVLLFILFVPVRYRIFVQNEKILEPGYNPVKNLKVQAKVSWLLHFIRFVVNYGPDGLSNEIYAAGADVRRLLSWLSRRKDAGSQNRQPRKKKKEKTNTKDSGTTNGSGTLKDTSTIKNAGAPDDSSTIKDAGVLNDTNTIRDAGAPDDSKPIKNTGAPDDSNTINISDRAEENNMNVYDVSTEETGSFNNDDKTGQMNSLSSQKAEETGSSSDSLMQDQTPGKEPDLSGSRPPQDQTLQKEADSTRDIPPDEPKSEKKRKRTKKNKNEKKIFSGLFSGISKKLQAVLDRFHSMRTKFFTLKGKIHKFQEEFYSPANRRVAGHLWKELCYMLCRYKPRKVKADITFSLADPALTGEVLGIISVLPHVYRYPYNINADFQSDKLYIEGDLLIQGKITGYVMVLILLRLFRDKECMQIVRRLMGRA